MKLSGNYEKFTKNSNEEQELDLKIKRVKSFY